MTAPRRKKRVRPARKIVPRGRMGIGWIVAPLVIAALFAVVAVLFLLFQGR